MILHLIDDDILGADTASAVNCPLARCLNRTLGVHTVSVGRESTWLDGPHGVTIPHTDAIKAFINAFDNGRGITSYELELPYDPTLP